MESAQWASINALELLSHNTRWILEVLFGMNNLDKVELAYCTHGLLLNKVVFGGGCGLEHGFSVTRL